MARKKIVFVIVEGPSDDQALGVLLSKLFDKNTVHVHIMHSDITTRSFDEPQIANIRTAVAAEVKGYARSNHFTSKDFLRIIHIMDTDGTFIPDDHVEEDNTLQKTFYSETKIVAKSRDAMIARNRQKSSNMRILSETKTIWNTIPYGAYFMSSNLDHVLHNKQNSTDQEKDTDSFRFAKRYRNDIPGFVKLMSDSAFSVCGDYAESWKYIEKGLHSLERHTNLALCFPQNETTE